MKLIRSKVPVTIPHRSGTKQGIVAIYISEWKWQDQLNRYVAEVIDYEVTDVTNPQEGQALKKYIEKDHCEKARVIGLEKANLKVNL